MATGRVNFGLDLILRRVFPDPEGVGPVVLDPDPDLSDLSELDPGFDPRCTVPPLTVNFAFGS